MGEACPTTDIVELVVRQGTGAGPGIDRPGGLTSTPTRKTATTWAGKAATPGGG